MKNSIFLLYILNIKRKGTKMEVTAISSSVQNCGNVNQSSMVIISKEDDDEKKKISLIAMCQSSIDGQASQYYRDSLGRPAIGTYNECGAINGSMQTLGSSINITA